MTLSTNIVIYGALQKFCYVFLHFVTSQPQTSMYFWGVFYVIDQHKRVLNCKVGVGQSQLFLLIKIGTICDVIFYIQHILNGM